MRLIDRSSVCAVRSVRIVLDVYGDNSGVRDKDAREVTSVPIFRVGLVAPYVCRGEIR